MPRRAQWCQLQLTPAPRQTTGNCGDTKMGATYMTSSSRARTYTTYALRYMASQKHMTLQKGSCKQAGYTKFVGNKKYTARNCPHCT